MSSSPDRPASRAPRVGIIRGATASDRPVLADVRNRLPVEVLDPVALQQVRQQAEDAGYADGYAAGLAKADQESARAQHEQRQRVAAVMTALVDAAQELRTREVATLDDIADQSAHLALQIAECVLRREVEAAADPGRDAIARALTLTPDEGEVRIRLHPDDVAQLGDVTDLLPGRAVQIVADGSVQRGGCLLHVDATRVDAQIPAALQRVAEVLR